MKTNIIKLSCIIISVFYFSINSYAECISGGDCENGFGTFIRNNLKYEGLWKHGKKHGYGTFYHETGQKAYEGQWKEDQFYGQGIIYDENGKKVYEGELKEGQRHGQGTTYVNNVKQYEGQWKEGKFHGQGTFYHSNGLKKYEGQFNEGKIEGQGASYYENGKKQFEGQWVNNQLHGYGASYDTNDKKVYEGEWRNGSMYNQATAFDTQNIKTSGLLTGRDGGFIFTFKNWGESQSLPKRKGDLIQAKKDAKFVWVKIQFQNDSKSSVDIHCMFHLGASLFDKNGRIFDHIKSMYEIEGNTGCNDNIQPGFSSQETIAFEIPSQFKPDQVMFWDPQDKVGNDQDSFGKKSSIRFKLQ